MSRRRRNGLVEDLFEITALMPWWVGVVLAVAAYFILHAYATAESPIVTKPGQMGEMFGKQMIKSLAIFGQYLLPIPLLAGAVASAIQRRRRQTLASSVAAGESASVLRDMSWQEFEQLVGEAFRLKGFAVAETGGGGADGGVDVVLTKGTEKFFVQCKQWRGLKVPVNTVRELYGVMAARGAAGGFVVTSGEFTGDAVDFAKGRNIELINGSALFKMFARVRAQPKSVSQGSSTAPKDPLCPQCGKTMVKRTAKRGANAGKPFWGCPGFPDCRGIRPID